MSQKLGIWPTEYKIVIYSLIFESVFWSNWSPEGYIDVVWFII